METLLSKKKKANNKPHEWNIPSSKTKHTFQSHVEFETHPEIYLLSEFYQNAYLNNKPET